MEFLNDLFASPKSRNILLIIGGLGIVIGNFRLAYYYYKKFSQKDKQ